MAHARAALLLFLTAPALAETAVPRDGPVFRGAVVIERDRIRLGEEPRRQLADFLLVETDAGKLVWTPDGASRVLGYRRIVAEEQRAALVALIRKAAGKARDHVTARRLYDWARSEGLAGRDERVSRKRVENAEEKPRASKRKARDEVLAEERELRARLPNLLVARVRLEPGGEARLLLLRDALSLAPRSRELNAMLEAVAPGKHPFGGAREWLTWRLDLQRHGYRMVAEDRVELKRTRHYWRPDLYGIESDDIMLMTPCGDIALLASTLRRAKICLDTLRALFKTDKPRARRKQPMRIDLFIHKKNFQEKVGYSKAASIPPYFRWSLGRYLPREDVSRFLASDDAARLHYVFLHELTRQWLWSRNPRFSTAKVIYADDAMGYWIVAGLPAMMAEGAYDVDAGTVDLAPKDARSLRLVQQRLREGSKDALLPWNLFLMMDTEEVHAMNGGKRLSGGTRPGYLYAMQAAVTCSYMYAADKGAHRQRLADYLVNHYLGNQPALVPQNALGKRAPEFGAAVVGWATSSSR